MQCLIIARLSSCAIAVWGSRDLARPYVLDTVGSSDVPCNPALKPHSQVWLGNSLNFCGAAVEIEDTALGIMFAADVGHADCGVRGG